MESLEAGLPGGINQEPRMSSSNSEKIVEDSQAPRRLTDPEGTVEANSIPDKIAADQYDKASKATKKTSAGLRFRKFKSPGAV